MVENNKGIHWVPETVGQKRFGNWLADARDWNISRNRFWEHQYLFGNVRIVVQLVVLVLFQN